MTGKSASRRVVTGIALLAVSWSAVAAAGVSSIVQLTNTVQPLPDPAKEPTEQVFVDGAYYPAISADGSTIAFTSDADLVPGENPNGIPNIFVMNSDGTGLRQLTHATIGVSQYARLSADGSVVVFESSADLTGENPPVPTPTSVVDENPPYDVIVINLDVPQAQIFVMNTDGTGLRQLTHGIGRNALNPDISGDGTMVVFESEQDPLGENGDFTREIFAVRSDGTGLVQLTVGTPMPDGMDIRDDESRNAVISRDGKTVAFDSFQDLVPTRNDDRSDEVFVFDLAGYLADAHGGSRAAYTVQLSDTDIGPGTGHIKQEESFQPSISADGNWIAFSACINPWGDPIASPTKTVPGTNATLADVIFVVKRDGSGLKQLTFSSNKEDDAQWPSISADGSVVIFSSDSLLADNIDTRGYQQIFAIRSDGTGLTQLTNNDRERGYIKSRISSDGKTAYFYTASDLAGNNPDHSEEIFAATFELPVAVVADTGGGSSGDNSGTSTTVAQSNTGTSSPDSQSTTTTAGGNAAVTSAGAPSLTTGALGLFELMLLTISGVAGVGAARRRA